MQDPGAIEFALCHASTTKMHLVPGQTPTTGYEVANRSVEYGQLVGRLVAFGKASGGTNIPPVWC